MAIQKISGVTIDLNNQASGDVTYFDGVDWVRLPKGVAGELLMMNASATAPEWGSPPWAFPGSIYGYAVMGMTGSPTDTIDKFSFVSDTNAVDHCDAFSIGSHLSCSRSLTHGYSNAGEIFPHYTVINRIAKFAFASSADGTDVADTLVAVGLQSGYSSETHGYIAGGHLQNAAITIDTIQKYTTSADANSTDVGDLSEEIGQPKGASSETHGYRMGGNNPSPASSEYSSERIDRFSFVTDGNATDIANLTLKRGGGAGCSSETHGYCAGGFMYELTPENPGSAHAYQDIIDKFSFATGADATDVGNLTAPNGVNGGCSSTTYGYVIGGYPNYIDRIDKFSFVTDGDATDIANLTIGRDDLDGTHN